MTADEPASHEPGAHGDGAHGDGAHGDGAHGDGDEEHGDPGYVGPATLVVDGAEVAVQVDLRGAFQPIDGRFHWYGRVARNAELAERVTGTRVAVVVRTPAGERPGELSDPDLWGRFRISGESTPPFDLDDDPPDPD